MAYGDPIPNPFFGAWHPYPHYYPPVPPVCPGCGRCNHCGQVAPRPGLSPYKVTWGTSTLPSNVQQA